MVVRCSLLGSGVKPYHWLSPRGAALNRESPSTIAAAAVSHENNPAASCCWNTNADERPQFKEIVKLLRDMANTFDVEQLATDVAGIWRNGQITTTL